MEPLTTHAEPSREFIVANICDGIPRIVAAASIQPCRFYSVLELTINEVAISYSWIFIKGLSIDFNNAPYLKKLWNELDSMGLHPSVKKYGIPMLMDGPYQTHSIFA